MAEIQEDKAERAQTERLTGLRREPTQARSRINIERILDALVDLYRQEVAEVTPKLLAETSGVSTATLYRFFPNIEAAEIACARRFLNAQDTVLEEILNEDTSTHWRDVNHAMIMAIAEQFTSDKTQRKILRRIYFSGAFQKANLPYREAFIETFAEALRARKLFQEGTPILMIARALVEISAAFQKMVLFAETKEEEALVLQEWFIVTEAYMRARL